MINKKIDGTMAFTPNDVADGKLNRFVNILLENNCEIRVWTDGYCQIVDYIDNGGDFDDREFVALGENEVVVDGKFVDWAAVEAADGK